MTTLTDGTIVTSSTSVVLPNPQGTSRCSFVAQVAVIALLMLVVLFGYGRWRTGSLELVWPWLMGQQLLFSRTHIDIGKVSANQMIEKQIRVVNVSSAPISLLGSQKSCRCLELDDFPLQIEPGTSRVLHIKIAIGMKTGNFAHSLKFFSDEKGYSYVIVPVTGSIQ